jgi:hypothetical protein
MQGFPWQISGLTVMRLMYLGSVFFISFSHFAPSLLFAAKNVFLQKYVFLPEYARGGR